MNYYYIWFTIFVIVLYLILTDQSIAKFITLITKQNELDFAKFMWWVKNNPKNPIVKYLMWRRSIKMAEELMKEIQNKNKDV